MPCPPRRADRRCAPRCRHRPSPGDRAAGGRPVGRGAVGRAGVVAARSPPRPRSNRIAAGTIGTRSCGSGPTGQPAPASYTAAATPSAADSPNALPPASTTASTAETRLRGSSRSVSRVPGPPPRTSTPPTVPGRRHDDGHPGQPARLVTGGVADAHAGDVGDRVVGSGLHRPQHDGCRPRRCGTGIRSRRQGLSAA